jgi:hypothetical protein
MCRKVWTMGGYHWLVIQETRRVLPLSGFHWPWPIWALFHYNGPHKAFIKSSGLAQVLPTQANPPLAELYISHPCIRRSLLLAIPSSTSQTRYIIKPPSNQTINYFHYTEMDSFSSIDIFTLSMTSEDTPSGAQHAEASSGPVDFEYQDGGSGNFYCVVA